MKYKIKNHLIDAKSPVEALKIHKLLDNVKDADLPKKGDKYSDKYHTYIIKATYSPFGHLSVVDLTREDGKDFTVSANEFERHFTKVNDVKDDDDIDYLSEEEAQAIEDYKKAIANTKDVKLLKLFAHILKEETEHLEELQSEEVEDSCKTKDDNDNGTAE